MATRKGSVKRVALEEISSIRRSGLIIMFLKADDELTTVRRANEEDDIIMVSGAGPVHKVLDIRDQASAPGRGWREGHGLGQQRQDRLHGRVVPDSKLLVISKKGYGKLTDLNRYRRQGRGGSGIKTLSITPKTGKLAAAEVIADSDQVYVVSEQAIVLRTSLSEIRSTGRAAQGVRILKPQAGDSVASMACVRDFKRPDSDEDAPESRTNGKGKGNGKVPPDVLAKP